MGTDQIDATPGRPVTIANGLSIDVEERGGGFTATHESCLDPGATKHD